MFKELRNGEYYHNDLARYQIYLESMVFETKNVLTRQDVLDIFNRVARFDAMDTRSQYSFENATVDDLPEFMRDFVAQSDVVKLEFMGMGRYKVIVSDLYETHFMSGNEIIEIAKANRIPPKLVDTCRFNQYDMVYRVWSESLYIPGSVISYTGPAIWRGDNKLAWTTMRVMSYIQAHDTIMTVTLLSRGSKFFRPFN